MDAPHLSPWYSHLSKAHEYDFSIDLVVVQSRAAHDNYRKLDAQYDRCRQGMEVICDEANVIQKNNKIHSTVESDVVR